jgi:hypothetical protein
VKDVRALWLRAENWKTWAQVFVPVDIYHSGGDAVSDWIIETFGVQEFQWHIVEPSTTGVV